VWMRMGRLMGMGCQVRERKGRGKGRDKQRSRVGRCSWHIQILVSLDSDRRGGRHDQVGRDVSGLHDDLDALGGETRSLEFGRWRAELGIVGSG
jgi:hypothetical protein